VHLGETGGWHFGMFTGLTIQGPLELFGLAHRGLGQFDPIRLVGGLVGETNVFSGLAMLLDDVGIVGTTAVMIILGWATTALATSFYRRPNMLKAIVLANLYLLLF